MTEARVGIGAHDATVSTAPNDALRLASAEDLVARCKVQLARDQKALDEAQAELARLKKET